MEVLWNTEKPIGKFSPFLKLKIKSNFDSSSKNNLVSAGIAIFPTSQKASNAFERPHKTISKISIMMHPMIMLGFLTSSEEKAQKLNNLITHGRGEIEEYSWDNDIHPESDKFVYANMPWNNKKYIETIFNIVSEKFCSIKEENIKEIIKILNNINI